MVQSSDGLVYGLYRMDMSERLINVSGSGKSVIKTLIKS